MEDGGWADCLDLSVEQNVPCRMRDGITLYADVYRPTNGGPHPVLLMRNPYDKTKGQNNVGYAHPSWYASQGYMVVMQDCRGRWSSEGDFYPFRNEAEDGYVTVEWAARLPGADGRVGMYGFSYPGATQLLAATLRPPSLATMCPGFTGSQYYEGWTYNQGAFALAFAVSWAAFLAIDSARRRRDDAAVAVLLEALYVDMHRWNWRLPLEEYKELFEQDAPYFLDWMDHYTYDSYWRQWSIDTDYSRIDVPALHIGGWYDTFISGTVSNFLGLRRGGVDGGAGRSQKLVIGPWYHMPWAPLGEGTPEDVGARTVDDLQIRWFDHFMKGRDTDVLNAPVTLFVMGEGWRDFDDWPPSGVNMVEYFFHSGGRANSATGDGSLSRSPPVDESPDVYTYDPLTPNPSLGGHSCCWEAPITPMGPSCQAASEAWPNMLVYTTAALEHDITVIGDVVVTLYASSSAVDTDFTARLCVVDGSCSLNVQEGIIRARFRESLSEPKLLIPGRVYEYRILLGPVGIRVPAGRRLRVDICSSDFPQWDRNLNTGGPLGVEGASAALVATQAVFHNRQHPSRITLPLVT
jgi:uncharacterized protein